MRGKAPAPNQPDCICALSGRKCSQAGGRESGWGRHSPAPKECGGSCRPRPPLAPLPLISLPAIAPYRDANAVRQGAGRADGAGISQPQKSAGAHAARAPLYAPRVNFVSASRSSSSVSCVTRFLWSRATQDTSVSEGLASTHRLPSSHQVSRALWRAPSRGYCPAPRYIGGVSRALERAPSRGYCPAPRHIS